MKVNPLKDLSDCPLVCMSDRKQEWQGSGEGIAPDWAF